MLQKSAPFRKRKMDRSVVPVVCRVENVFVVFPLLHERASRYYVFFQLNYAFNMPLSYVQN